MQAPVLVIFEDVHWIDPTTLEALSAVVDRIQDMSGRCRTRLEDVSWCNRSRPECLQSVTVSDQKRPKSAYTCSNASRTYLGLIMHVQDVS